MARWALFSDEHGLYVERCRKGTWGDIHHKTWQNPVRGTEIYATKREALRAMAVYALGRPQSEIGRVP